MLKATEAWLFSPGAHILRRFIIHPDLPKHGLKLLLGATVTIGLLGLSNKLLNTYALNHWAVLGRGRWDWSSEVAVVTGGCGGIGKHLVLGLRQKGVKVAILDLSPPPNEFVDDPSILYLETDLSSPVAVTGAAEQIRNIFHSPSILINNAGIATPHSILDAPPEFLSKIFAVNTVSMWLTAQNFLPDMIKQNKGHILSIGSLTSYMALPSMVDYCASKAAALTFHEGLNCELKTKHKVDGIITTIVQPSWVRTPMSPENADEIERKQGKMLRPEDVAKASLDYIWARRGGQIILPKGLAFFTGIRGWPNWTQEWIRDAMGKASLL